MPLDVTNLGDKNVISRAILDRVLGRSGYRPPAGPGRIAKSVPNGVFLRTLVEKKLDI